MRFVNSIIALVLLSIVLGGAGIRTFVTLNFYLHQSEIAAEKCENKARPEMQCNGKCYLAKQLKATESKEESPAAPVSPDRFSFPDLSFLLSKHSVFAMQDLSRDENNSAYLFKRTSSPFSSIPQPPPES